MKTTAERAGGWGDAGPDGLITGGEGGSVYTFIDTSTYAGQIGFYAMWKFIGDNPITPMILIWAGSDVDLLARNFGTGSNTYPNRIPSGSGPEFTIENKTLFFAFGQVLRGGSFQFQRWKNCIIRNLVRKGDDLGGEPDYLPHAGNALAFITCERLWIHHCELDGEATLPGTEKIKDGTIDFGVECDYITVSECYIRRSSKTALISWANDEDNDRGKLRITYRNNLWENNHTRQPFVRFGKIHLLNNVFRYNPVFTNSDEQYPWARIIELGIESQVYSQGCVYRGHRYFLKDNQYLEGEDSLSGFVSDGDFYDPSPVFSSFSDGSVAGNYKGYGSLRSNRVEFNPNEIIGYNYPVPLQTTESQVIDYVELWAGAKYHLIDGGFSLNLSTTTGGTATRDPASGDIEQNATVILTATPSTGFNFSRWQNVLTGQVLSQNETYNHVMLADISIVAVFVSDVPVDPSDAIRFCRINEPIV